MKLNPNRVVIWVLILMAVILLSSVLTSCLPTSETGGQTTAATSVQTTDQTFTLQQLAQYDGQNGNKAYIAVDGVVYDVTEVAVWDHKLHTGRFIAGKDYSAELKKAPHGASMLSQAKKVGVLAP
jgi:predicted heme/steroid binding protein